MTVKNVLQPDAATRSTDHGAEDLRTLTRASGFTLVGLVCKAVCNIALAIVVTRGLGASQSGVFFSAVALFTILMTVAEAGAHTALVRSVSRYRALDRIADVRPLLAVSLAPVFALGVLLAALLVALAPFLAQLLLRDGDPDAVARYLRLLALFLPFAATSSAALSATRGLGTIRPYVLVEHVAVPLSRPLLALAAVALGFGGAGVALTWGGVLAGAFVAALVLLAGRLRSAERGAAEHGSAGRQPLRRIAADFWGFSAPRGVSSIFQVGVSWLDVLLVASLRSPREAGIYAAASRGVVLGTFGLQALRMAIAPQFSALLARGDRERAERLYQVATWWLITVSWPPFLVLAIFAPVVLQVFGPEFVEGAPALRVLALAMLFNLSTGNVTTMLLMGGKSGWNLGNTSTAFAVNVALNLVLIPRHGILGAAIAWTASIVVENVLALSQVRWLLGVRAFGRGYPLAAVSALGCFGALGLLTRALGGSTPAALVFTVAVGGGIYLLLLWRMRHVLQLGVIRQSLRRRSPQPRPMHPEVTT